MQYNKEYKLLKDTKRKGPKKTTHLRIVSEENGTRKRSLVKKLGVLGRDVTITEAKRILESYKDKNKNPEVHEVTLYGLYQMKVASLDKEVQLGQIKPKTLTCFKESIERFINSPKFKNVPLSQYNIDTALDIKIHLKEVTYTKGNQPPKKYSRDAIRNSRTQLHRMLEYAVDKRLIDSYARMPKLTEIKSKKIKPTYSKDQINALLTCGDWKIEYITLLFMESGIRPEEAPKLRLDEDFYWDEGYFVVSREERGEDRVNKTGGEVPLSQKLKARILKLMQEGKLTNSAFPWKTCQSGRTKLIRRIRMNPDLDALFPEEHPINLKMFRTTFNERMREFGFNREQRATILRHTESTNEENYTGDRISDSIKHIEDFSNYLEKLSSENSKKKLPA